MKFNYLLLNGSLIYWAFLTSEILSFQPADVDCCKASTKTLCQLDRAIFDKVKGLEKQLSSCCSTIGKELDHILKALSGCGSITSIGQANIPFQSPASGYFCLKEDVVFDGNTIVGGEIGPTATAFSGENVVFDLNNHTIHISGDGTNGVALFANIPPNPSQQNPRASTHMLIKNGTIIGSTDSSQAGIIILTNNVTVSNVRIINLSGASSSGITIQGGIINSILSPTLLLATLNDILIDQVNLVNNNFGIQLDTFSNGVTIQNTAIDRSVQMGITQPSRKNNANNVTLNNVTISNSGLNGIYTTFSQTNWSLNNIKVSDSGLNGMIFAAFQNLQISNSQISNSGAHGIVASIRQNKNIDISHTQIFNSQDELLRVDNTENLSITHCEFTNYIATTEPLVKLQDIYNATVMNCQFNSVAGTSDGLFLRNVHGVTVETSKVNIFCNQPRTTCPVGFNIHGGVDTTVLRSCTVSGNPSIGIAIVPDSLNGPNSGVIVENSIVQGAVTVGVQVSESTQTALFNNNISNGTGDGILIDASSLETAVRHNTLTNNTGFGINNAGLQSSIFSNFASSNGAGNYSGVALVSAPTATTGVLVNIGT